VKVFIRLLRSLVPASVRAVIKRALGMPTTRLHPDEDGLASDWFGRKNHVVLDVGTHNGWFFHNANQGQMHMGHDGSYLELR
jgi:hypothetical protein